MKPRERKKNERKKRKRLLGRTGEEMMKKAEIAMVVARGEERMIGGRGITRTWSVVVVLGRA